MASGTSEVPAGLRRSNPLARPTSRTRQTSFLTLNETLMLASFLTLTDPIRDGPTPLRTPHSCSRFTLKIIVPYSRGGVQTRAPGRLSRKRVT